jgi:hypothetical protein
MGFAIGILPQNGGSKQRSRRKKKKRRRRRRRRRRHLQSIRVSERHERECDEPTHNNGLDFSF